MSDPATSKRAWSPAATRGSAAAMALFVLVQAALAGTFLSGSVEARDLHGTLGESLGTTLALAVVVVATMAWRSRRLRASMALMAAVGLVAVVVQVFVGFSGNVAVHVPLGVATFGLYLSIAHMAVPRTSNLPGNGHRSG